MTSADTTGLTAEPGAEANGSGGGSDEVLIEVRNLAKHFPIHKGILNRTVGHVRAVDGISFDLKRGSTVVPGGRVRLRQDHHRAPRPAPARAHGGHRPLRGPRPGRGVSSGAEVAPSAAPDHLPGSVQLPRSRMSTASIVGEGLEIHGILSGDEKIERVAQLLEMVGLSVAT